MNYYGRLKEANINDITVDGWMREYLKTQAKGLAGNLDRCGEPYNCYGWYKFDLDSYCDNTTEGLNMLQKTGKEVPKWWPYEQTAYLLDGMERCGQLLGDRELLSKAKKSFDFTLNHQNSDGFLGPRFLKIDQDYQKWPIAVFMRALLAHYSATQDKKIPAAIKRHYIDNDFQYCKIRDVMNVEAMLLTYGILGDGELLDRAIDAYEKYNSINQTDSRDEVALSDKKPYDHGVTYNEYSKLGAILYMYTGNKKFLDASKRAYRKIDRYFMLASGLHCSNEHIRPIIICNRTKRVT